MFVDNERINRILNAIEIPDEFGGYRDEDYYCSIADDFEYDLRKNYNEDVEIAHGVSKCVIVPANADYVIKIPFNGRYDSGEAWDDELEDWVDNESCWYEYKNAWDYEEYSEHYEYLCSDYCTNEYDKYCDAVDAGFGQYFAETQYYCDKNGRKIYIQEKVTPQEDDWSTHSSEYAKKQYANNEELRFVSYAPSLWTQVCIDYYGVEETIRLLKYLKEKGLTSDLHNGNVGYRSNGAPVLLDWSGFRDNDDY